MSGIRADEYHDLIRQFRESAAWTRVVLEEQFTLDLGLPVEPIGKTYRDYMKEF